NASDVEACAAQIEADVAVHVDLSAEATSDVNVDTKGVSKAGVSCSISPRARLLRSAGTTSILTTTFALLGALYILRRRRF
ncbi:MAG TPA: hypothetical protein VMI54_06225, partial [Polyangiaceae bacterium]|nr:hypothetical protein [Polyangiaceae bacterium]